MNLSSSLTCLTALSSKFVRALFIIGSAKATAPISLCPQNRSQNWPGRTAVLCNHDSSRILLNERKEYTEEDISFPAVSLSIVGVEDAAIEIAWAKYGSLTAIPMSTTILESDGIPATGHKHKIRFMGVTRDNS
eukprot:CAMPEP_0194390394 /NCGR_PEP_ID=MMETSP0174-20130528/109853_1 /TAXON_ID=216777 /ORGANISM="Proboscia alata, Strain PI-D3" /LENGTH=133 /DNA_ID=CAMNT_0039183711 /DNA_START=166 /DNA_END=564 /DNA_ORIENTATION=+